MQVKSSLTFNKFTVDDEYIPHNRGNLLVPLKMQLFKKTKDFLGLFIVFLESALNLRLRSEIGGWFVNGLIFPRTIFCEVKSLASC